MAHSGKTMTFATDLVPQEDNIYNLGLEDQRWKIFGDIQPIASKTFSGFYATANNDNRKIAFFGTVTRNSPTIPWRIKLKLTATIPNYPDYAYTDWDIDYWGQGAATKAQYIKVNHGTNYALYSLQIYYPKNTTDNNVLIGVYIYANNNYNNSAYARTIKVDYIDGENCDFSFNNSLLYRESITTADYTAVGITLNATGYQETGDANSNTYDRTYMNNNKKARGAIVAGSICVGNADGYIGIDNGVTFDITYPILYMGTAINSGAQRSDFYIYQASITSTVNTTGLTHIANGILYMTGTLNGNIFTCNSKTLTYTEPSDEDGLIYIPVGINTNATSQSFYFLGGIAQMYWYKDGAFRPYVQMASSVPLSGVTGADDLQAIEALSGTGLLKKTAENTWALDANNYVTSSGITSVTIGATSPVQSSTSTAQNGSSASTTISLKDAYGDTKNPYGSKTKNYVLAAPSDANGAPSFRALVATDIPNKIQANWELNATSGNSPALLFTRDGSLTDWKIFVTSGKLSFQSATDGSTWTERAYFKDNSGDFVATSFTGKGSALTDLNASNLSSGTVPVARLPLATTSAAGAVKIGSGISVSDGTISVTAADLGLGNVENTKLSTWTGSANITTVGTISTGTWHGTKIANDYIANPKVTIAGNDVSLGGSLSDNTLRESLGLSKALRFVGVTTTDMTGGTATNHSWTGTPAGISNYTPKQGDVVINSTKQDEWVCTSVSGTIYTWERLGSDTSYKIVQSAVSDPTASTTTSTTFIDTISQNTNGVITATKKTLPTASSTVAGITKVGASGGAAAYNHTHTISLTQTGTSTINLAANTVYTLTAGGNSVVFKTPADQNTDTKVTQAYSTNNAIYPILMTATAGNTSTSSRGDTTAILNNSIYANPSTGQLNATSYKVNEAVTLQYNPGDSSLEFIF